VSIAYASGWEDGGGFPSGSGLVERKAILTAEEWMVRERWFFSDITLAAAGQAIKYTKAPVVDFIMALTYSLDKVAADGASRFRVDGGPALALERAEGKVDIRGGSGFGAVVDFIDMAGACAIFRRQFIDEVTLKFPDLLMNDLIERLFRGSGLRETSRDHFLRHKEAARLKNEIMRQGPEIAG
jgi:hypothetical protein